MQHFQTFEPSDSEQWTRTSCDNETHLTQKLLRTTSQTRDNDNRVYFFLFWAPPTSAHSVNSFRFDNKDVGCDTLQRTCLCRNCLLTGTNLIYALRTAYTPSVEERHNEENSQLHTVDCATHSEEKSGAFRITSTVLLRRIHSLPRTYCFLKQSHWLLSLCDFYLFLSFNIDFCIALARIIIIVISVCRLRPRHSSLP